MNFRSHPFFSHFTVVCLATLLFLLAACGQNNAATFSNSAASSTATPVPVDVYGTPVVMPKSPPQRVVSLVPNTSEILGALNVESRVVGIDFNTNYPASLTHLPRVSNATGEYNVEQIVALKPDLVLSYGAETKTYDTQLKQLGLNVMDLPASNLSQTFEQISLIGRVMSVQTTADKLVQQLKQQVNDIEKTVAGTTAPTMLLEVDDSTAGKPFVFGGGSFGDELATDANARNIFHTNNSNAGYPQVTDEAIITANPQIVLLTEDPAFGGDPTLVYKRPNWGGIAAVKSHKVYRVNANIIQRAGPRIVQGLRCVAQLAHPDKFPGALPDYCSAKV